jgi:leucyl-tRNA synthetase
VDGSYRFLKRLWAFACKSKRYIDEALVSRSKGRFDWKGSAWKDAAPSQKKNRYQIHKYLQQANYDLRKHQFNTVASAAMKMLNLMEETDVESVEAGKGYTPCGNVHAEFVCESMEILLRLLSPITPHICHTLWRELSYGEDILSAPWPEPLDEALVQDEIELVLQINGKLRGSIRVPAGATKEQIEQPALASEVARKFMEGKPAKKVIVVPGRLVNIVV